MESQAIILVLTLLVNLLNLILAVMPKFTKPPN